MPDVTAAIDAMRLWLVHAPSRLRSVVHPCQGKEGGNANMTDSEGTSPAWPAAQLPLTVSTATPRPAPVVGAADLLAQSSRSKRQPRAQGLHHQRVSVRSTSRLWVVNVICVTACYGLSGCNLGERVSCDGFRFDRAAWSAPGATRDGDGGSKRQVLLEGLMTCERLEGRSAADVRRLLGKPESSSPNGDGTRVWEWVLGRRNSFGPGAEYLSLFFKGGVVVDLERG